MIQNENQKIYDDVHKVLEEILQKMNMQASVTRMDFFGAPYFQVEARDSSLLVGEGGQCLYALQTFVRRAVEQRNGESCPPFLVDVNDYQRHHIERIKEHARMGAQRVRYFKKDVVLEPMNSYERRIVHATLMEDPDVETESIGEGENRKVVIKPANL